MNAYFKNVSRTILNNFRRYFAMVLINAMGVAFFVGLRSTSFDMNHTLNTYFDAQGVYDLRIMTNLGLTEEQTGKLAKTPGVERAFAAHYCDMFITLGTGSSLARIHSLDIDERGDAINTPHLINGRLPESADECLVEERYLTLKGGSIGDIVDVATGTDDPLDDFLNRGRYRVSGTVESPVYISQTVGTSSKGNGTLDTYMYILPENFSSEYYSEVYLRLENARSRSRFSDEYTDLINPVIESLESLSDEMASSRYDDVTQEGWGEIEDGKREIADAKRKLEDAETELSDAYIKISDGETELLEKTAEFHTKIADAELELADGRQKLDDAWQEVTDAKQKLEDAKIEIADGKADLRELKDGMRELADELGVKKLDQVPEKMRENLQEFFDGETMLREARRELSEGRRELMDGKKLLEQGEAELDANAGALAEARTQLAGLEQQLADVTAGKDTIIQYFGEDESLYPPETAAQWQMLTEAEMQLTGGIALIGGELSKADAARSQIESGWLDLEYGEEELSEGSKELRKNEATLARKRKNLEELAEKLEIASIEELPQGLRDLIDKIPEAEQEIADAEKEIADAEKELRDAEQTLSEKTLEYEDGVRELADGRVEGLVKIADAEQELADAKIEVDDGMRKYEDAKAEADEKLPDAERDIADAEQKLSDLDDPKSYVLGLDSNIGFVSFKQDSERIDKISLYFPLIFFLVATLVSFTSMVRVVENDRPTIGALKSLGYGNASIIGKYIFFALAVCVPGCAIGILFGNHFFPSIVFDQGYRIMYQTPAIITVLQWRFCALAFGISLISVLIPTFTVCASELAGVPAVLLRPKPPRSGKRILLERIPFLWKRMSFSTKVTARNIFRYKKRFFMTVTGVAGCAAILLTGFGLRDSINVIVQKQFGPLFKYGLEITLKEHPKQADVASMEQFLRDVPYTHGTMYRLKDSYDCQSNGETQTVTLCVPQASEAIGDFVSLRVSGSDETLSLGNDGAIITQKLAKLLNVTIGSELILKDDDDREFTVKVSGVTENYVAHYVYMNDEYYRKIFDSDPVFNGLWCLTGEIDPDTESEFSAELLLNEAVTGVSFTTKSKEFYIDTINSLNIVVLVLVISGALLSFVVLFSLTGINIDERQRELATLKVLGFYDRETASYIFRESTVSTLIGTLAGLPAGILMHLLVMSTAETDFVMFGREIAPLSFVATIILSFVFLGIVNWVMGFHIRKIDMIESLKSVE